MSYELSAKDGAIAEFLGKDAAAGGPFAILGLRYEPIDEPLILRACQMRLAQINGHHRAQSPAADEVRLAVHSAASQLLDPELCAELAKHWPEGTWEIESGGDSPKAWRVESKSRLDEGIRRQAVALLGACGGWNARSRKRLGQFARMHKVSAAQLVAGIIGDRGEPVHAVDGIVGGIQTERATVRGPSLIDPSPGALPWTIIPVAYVLMGMALVSVGYVKHRSDVVIPAAEISDARQPSDTSAESVFESSQRERESSPSRRHYSSILHELELAEREGVFDLDSAARFSEVGERLVRQWTEFSGEELDQAVMGVRGVLGGIINNEIFEAASSFLAVEERGPVSMLSLAMRSWLFGAEDHSPDLTAMTSRAFDTGKEGAFDSDLLEVFENQAVMSSDESAWWVWWLSQLEPLRHRGNPVIRESLLLESVYQRLMDGTIGDGWAESSRDIVLGVEWGSGSAGRSWFMGVVVDPRVRSDRLSVLTRAIVVHSSARGLGLDMIIEADDSIADREAYLVRLREQWASDEAVADGVGNQLIERIETLLRMTRNPLGRNQAMIRGVELARVNSACWVRDGNEAMLIKLIELFDSPIESIQASGLALDLSSSEADRQWATDARNIASTEEFMEHLGVLDRFVSIGPKSAHALVYLAMQAPDLQVRDQAERSMLARRDDPAILIALDRIAGASRTTRRMVELINSYVGREGDLGDPQSSRLALLKRLVQVGILDDGGSSRGVQDFSHALDELFAMRALSQDGDHVQTVYEELVFGLLERGVDVPAGIRARLLVRLRSAAGPMQRFAAYQSAGFEVLAFQIADEHPALKSRVDRVLNESVSQQLEGKDVIDQIMLIERSMAELWLIVLESEGVS